MGFFNFDGTVDENNPKEILFAQQENGQYINPIVLYNIDASYSNCSIFVPDQGTILIGGWDTDNDGRQDTWAVYTNGELSERRVDANRDGKPDNWEFYENSRLVRSLHDANSDGDVDQWVTYDASEQAHRSERDLNRDGKDLWSIWGMTSSA